MSRALSVCILTLALAACLLPARSQDGDGAIGSGAEHLGALGDGTLIVLTAPDGGRLELEVEGGALLLAGPAAELADGVVTTPGGYRISALRTRRRVDFVVTAPAQSRTHIHFTADQILAQETDGGVWSTKNEVLVAYLADGTRIDFDRPERVIQVSVDGTSWRVSGDRLEPTDEVPPTLQAVNPTTVYQTGDGDDWIALTDPKGTMAAWLGPGAPFAIDDIVGHARERDWIRAGLGAREGVGGPEAAALLLAGFFAMPPGSLVQIGEDAPPVMIVPGSLAIPSSGVMTYSGPTTMP